MRKAHPVMLAEQAASGDGSAVAHRAQLLPYEFFGDGPEARGGFEAAIRRGYHAMRIADGAGGAFEAVGHNFGMLDVVGSRIDDSGDEDHVGGKAMAFEATVFVLVARVGHRKKQRADARLEQNRQDVVESDVTIMRTLIIAPADVQAGAIGRDVQKRPIDRGDDHLDEIEEILEWPIGEGGVTFESEVGCINLKYEATRNDGFIFDAKGVGQRRQV